MARPRQARVAFIAWSRSGRAADFAAALDGDARVFFDLRIVKRWLIPVRYAVSAARTIAYLTRARPRAVIVTSPPVFPGLIALLYSRLTGAPLVVDAHPASFGLKGDRTTRLLLPLQAFVARRAALSIVTVPELVERVARWRGKAAIVHEAPPSRAPRELVPLADRPRVLFVTIFEPDEPVEAVMEAARHLPDVEIQVTGDPRKCPAEVRRLAPGNVVFTGFLDAEAYYRAMEESALVIALTTRSQAVSRVGSEAVYLGRPLVISDTAAAREAFPHATHVANTSGEIAAGVRAVLKRYDVMPEVVERAARVQRERWQAQVKVLVQALSLPASGSLLGEEQNTNPEHKVMAGSPV